jgi:hypothetical protein
MWSLSQHWYGDRLDRSFMPRTLEATQQLLDDAGLTSDFWKLRT